MARRPGPAAGRSAGGPASPPARGRRCLGVRCGAVPRDAASSRRRGAPPGGPGDRADRRPRRHRPAGRGARGLKRGRPGRGGLRAGAAQGRAGRRAAAGAGARRPSGGAGPAASGGRHGDRQDRRRRGRGCAARYPGQRVHAGRADVARPEHGAARGLALRRPGTGAIARRIRRGPGPDRPLARRVCARPTARGPRCAGAAAGARRQHSLRAGRRRPLLADRDPQVRINALRALATFHDSAFARLAVPLAGDADVNVAVQAETTLGVLGGRAAVEALGVRLASAVFALRRQALIALAQADSAAGVTAAAALLGDADWRWRSVAAEAFGAAHHRPRLDAQLADADGRVVAQALQTLARIVPEADTTLGPRARELLVHPDPAVRSVAADLLARHPATADVDRLIQAYTRAAGDPFDDARLSRSEEHT